VLISVTLRETPGNNNNNAGGGDNSKRRRVTTSESRGRTDLWNLKVAWSREKKASGTLSSETV
jgi:hypothetical protein